jgi:DNA topoisomerase I
MDLVIVESPTKAKTITKFLGSAYKVESSFGHIRDLPTKDMGIDLEGDFHPTYIVPEKSQKTVDKLKEIAKKAKTVILASDEDREGEAIAWHLKEALGLDEGQISRIVFHEITKDAILSALQNPRNIDMRLVDAQQARRVLDRLVGYELSPFLWKKVARGLSAGRVQSAAVRLVVEREREIQAFNQEEYWSIDAHLHHSGMDFQAKLHKRSGKVLDKMAIKTEAEANTILEQVRGREFVVATIEKKKSKKNPPNPFTTSTLQQAANRLLGFSAKQTMTIAQKLYEGINIGAEGQVGLITYMRTDSLNLSDKFLSEAKEYLTTTHGEKYALKEARRFKTKSKGAQEAHEAIRPTGASRDPETIKEFLDNNQFRLYRLIWQRSLASQMPEAQLDATTVDIDAQGTNYQFRSSGQILRFDGYLKIYPETSTDVELPAVDKGDQLEVKEVKGDQHFTKPPARYSDAGLVKVMERYGIGRPSTYAPTIATIEARNYVIRSEKRLAPTDIAFVVTDLLVNHFSDIVDFKFTAQMENNLDGIAAGKTAWVPIIAGFYGPFHANLEQKYNEVNKKDIMPEETSEEKCDKCGAAMIVKTGRYGKFLACSAYPACKNIKSMGGENRPEMTADKSEEIKALEEKYKDEKCDKCGAAMAIKNGRYGPFLACTAYPSCKNIKNIGDKAQSNSTGVACPACGKGEIVAKRGPRGVFYACNQYPDCKNAYWGKPTGEKCPDCGALMVEDTRSSTIKCSSKDCGKKKE